MATRSDFAQKLLTDLRSRKERMAAPASHNTSNSKGMSRDSYANPSQHHKGSRQTKPLDSVGTRSANPQRRTKNGASLTIEESSNQLVPYGGGQSSEQIRDLSRAIALALQNKGNFTKSNSSSNNPILTFLHRIGIRKMDKRNSNNFKKLSNQTINLSNIHINEISKGAQKLNQILRACSNGVTIDGYSVEIGRELLKGAMNLEESLQMLANLQEASEQVINSKKKSRIKLLDENGEEVEEERETSSSVPLDRLVERPRFSFDQPSRNSRGTKKAIKSDPIRSLMALSLTYTTETKTGKQPLSTSGVTSHKRSASCSPDFRPEKGRLPNVIAKLMGLEEVPQKEGVVSETNANTNSKIVEKITKTAENMSRSASERKMMQNNSFKVPNADTKSVSGPQFSEKFPRYLNIKIRRQDTTKHGKDIGLERGQAKRVVDHYHKDTEAKITRKGTSDSKEIKLEREKRNTDREEKPRVGKRDQQHVKEKETMPKPKTEGQPSNRSSKEREKPYMLSTNTKNKTGLLRNRRSMNSVPKEIISESKNPRGSVPQIKEDKPAHSIATERMIRHVEIAKRESHRRKDEVMIKGNESQQKTEMTFKDQISPSQKRKQLKLASKGVNLSEGSLKEAEVHVISPEKTETRTKILIEHVPTEKEAEKEAEACIVSPKKSEASTEILIKDVTLEKEFEVTIDSPRKSEASTKLLIEDLPSKIEAEEDPTINNSIGSELQSPIIGENIPNPNKSVVSSKKSELKAELLIEDVSSEKEHEVHIVSPKISEASTKLLIEDLSSEKEAEKDPTTNSSNESELHSPIVGENLRNPSKNSRSQDMATEISIEHIDNKYRLPSPDEDTYQESQKFELHPENGCNEARLDDSNPQEHEQKNPISENDELWTESEIHLKRTLLRSRIFLNAAEALFDLSIPADICHVTDYIGQDDTSKIMLDSAYEIMRKKGKRQELSLYPLQKISNPPFKVTSFHNLVKQLNTDLEKLKIINEDTNEGQDTEMSIQEMLERDVQNRDTDMNTVWDLGWSEVAFAIIERNELIKDLERFLIDSVIDDIAKELLHLNAYI